MVRTTYHLGSWKGLTIEDWHCRWVSVPIQPYQQAFHEGIPLNPATLGRQEVGPIHNGGQGSWYYLLYVEPVTYRLRMGWFWIIGEA